MCEVLEALLLHIVWKLLSNNYCFHQFLLFPTAFRFYEFLVEDFQPEVLSCSLNVSSDLNFRMFGEPLNPGTKLRGTLVSAVGSYSVSYVNAAIISSSKFCP